MLNTTIVHDLGDRCCTMFYVCISLSRPLLSHSHGVLLQKIVKVEIILQPRNTDDYKNNLSQMKDLTISFRANLDKLSYSISSNESYQQR